MKKGTVKVEIEKELVVCDFCDKDIATTTWNTKCSICHKDTCRDCRVPSIDIDEFKESMFRIGGSINCDGEYYGSSLSYLPINNLCKKCYMKYESRINKYLKKFREVKKMTDELRSIFIDAKKESK